MEIFGLVALGVVVGGFVVGAVLTLILLPVSEKQADDANHKAVMFRQGRVKE